MSSRPDTWRAYHGDNLDHGSTPAAAGQALTIDTKTANYSRPRPPAMPTSPPPTPHSSRHDKLSFRLRSNSGMSLHTNEDALRRYTDYNADGSPRTPTFGPVAWGSIDGVAAGPNPRSKRAPSVAEASPALPIPDFFSRDTFHAVLRNPVTFDRLSQLAQVVGSDGDVEFLYRVQNYSRSLEQFLEQVSLIPKPAELPSTVSRSLNMDMRHLTTSIFPGLENLFNESQSHIEQRVWKSTYPLFVKQQLSLLASSTLFFDRKSRSDFPGLGTSFFLADAQVADTPIQSTSDGFLNVTGYSRDEILLRGFGFLHGPQTDRETTRRLREAILRGEEAMELVLNYRRDGCPFWSLFCLFPVPNAEGNIRYYLGGQVNISETISSADDILRVLGYEYQEPEGRDRYGDSDADSSVGRRPSTRDCPPDRKPSVQQRPGPTKGFFKQFRKPSSSSTARSDSQSHSPQSQSQQQQTQQQPLSPALSAASTFGSEYRPDLLSPYSRFMLLRHCAASKRATLSTSDARGQKSSRLELAHASDAALELLGLDASFSSDALLSEDIFTILSEHANSPSVNKNFKTAVRERVSRDGKCTMLDILLSRSTHRRQGSIGASFSSRSTTDVRDGSAMYEGAWREREREKESKKSSRPASRAGFAGLVGAETTRMERLGSYWTPLKGSMGSVEWVVVILTPAG